jgi:hypothetical protein
MNENQTCKLCGSNAKLLKQSHIIPSFMYTGLFDERNRILLHPLSNQSSKPKYFQTGFYDKDILCSKCDNELIGSLEKYSSTILYGGKTRNPPEFEKRISKDGIRSIQVKNIDYTKFKLFLLSILWRAHISKNKFFKNVNLSEHEQTIREMILLNDAKKESDFPISIIAVQDLKNKTIRIIPNPEVKKNGELHIAIFFINGYFYFIDLSKSNSFSLSKNHNLKETNEIEIGLVDRELAFNLLTSIGIPPHIANNFVNK